MTERVLIIGYGNPGRLDDGLGPAFAAAVEAMGFEHVAVESDYQLTVEDAADVACHDITLLVDASTTGDGPFSLRNVQPATTIRFTTHTLAPEGLLSLTHELFNPHAKALILGIRGYDFDAFGEGLSEGATANLRAALEHLRPHLAAGTLGTLASASRQEDRQTIEGCCTHGSESPWQPRSM